MRQVGILAAAGLYALENNFRRLAEDHEKAKTFAKIISDSQMYEVNVEHVETNIVIFGFKHKMSMDDFIAEMKSKGVLISAGSAGKLRAVTHLDVSMENVRKAAETLAKYRAD